MKIFSFMVLCFLLCGCSAAPENQPRQNFDSVDTLALLPPQWTETATPTGAPPAAIVPSETDTPTLTETDTPPDTPQRYYESASDPHFSYFPPRGWLKVFNPSTLSKFKEPTSWTTSDRDCELHFLMMATGSLMTAKEFLHYQLNGLQPIKIFSEGSFPNAAGLDGYRAAFQATVNGPMIMYYEFHKGYATLEGAYSCKTEINPTNDKLIDQSMESVQFDS